MVQVVDGPDATSRWRRAQHRETIEIPAGRGTIYDRTGEPLAIGEQATTVYADPRHVVAPMKAAVKAGEALGLDPDELYPALARPVEALRLRRAEGRPGQGGGAAAAWASPGFGFYPEERRSYPQGARRVARARIRRHRQPRPRRPRALARQDAAPVGPGYEIVVRDPAGRAIDVVTSRARARRAGTSS